MAKYQDKPSIVDVAARRHQTVAQLVADWAVASLHELVDRCEKEGVSIPTDLTLSFVNTSVADDKHVKVDAKIPYALVDLSKKDAPKNSVKPEKKSRKSKVTLDETDASDEHVGLDPKLPSGSEDAT